MPKAHKLFERDAEWGTPGKKWRNAKVVKPRKVRDKFWLAGELLKLPNFNSCS